MLRRALPCRSLQPMEIFVDDEAKLTLHGLVQHYIMLQVGPHLQAAATCVQEI